MEEVNEKNYSGELKIQNILKEAVTQAIREGREKVTLDDGQSLIVLRVVMDKEKDNYRVLLGNKNIVMAKQEKDGKVTYSDYIRDLEKVINRFDVNSVKILSEMEKQKKQEEIKNQALKGNEVKVKTPEGKDELLKREMEDKITKGEAIELEIDREMSTSENMSMFVKRAWKISPNKIYRVRNKNPHDFKYVAKLSNGNYKEINLSSFREGKNSKQKIWLIENGILRQKTVDSILIKGQYAIATDIPDNVMTEHTRTYLVAITPGGKYIAIGVGQKQGVHRNTSGDSLQKDYMSREHSVYELEDIITAAELAERIYGFNRDGKLTTKEVEIVRRLQVNGQMDDNDIINIINAICLMKEMGYSNDKIRDIIDDVKDAPNDKNAVKRLIDRQEKERQNEEKNNEYVGYGQKRPH